MHYDNNMLVGLLKPAKFMSMCRYRMFYQISRGSNFDGFFLDFFFLADDGRREDPNNTKSGPSTAHQQNAN